MEFQGVHQAKISFLNYYSWINAKPNRYKENLTYTEISNEEISPTKLKNTEMPSKDDKMHIWHPY